MNEEWNALLPKAEHIVALTLFVDKLKDNNLKLPKVIVKSGGQGNKDGTTKAAKNLNLGASGANKSSKNNKSDLYAWKKVPPASGEKHTGKSMGEHYCNWCP